MSSEMNATATAPTSDACPHCGSRLSRFQMPDEAGFGEGVHLACFNDECPYYVRGWTWMSEHFGVHTSYRYRIDPGTGEASPLAVWSPTAIKDRILPEGRVET